MWSIWYSQSFPERSFPASWKFSNYDVTFTGVQEIRVIWKKWWSAWVSTCIKEFSNLVALLICNWVKLQKLVVALGTKTVAACMEHSIKFITWIIFGWLVFEKIPLLAWHHYNLVHYFIVSFPAKTSSCMEICCVFPWIALLKNRSGVWWNVIFLTRGN